MDKNNNGCNLLDEIQVREGYKGFMLAYMRSILGERFFAVVNDLEEMFDEMYPSTLEHDDIIDRALLTRASETEAAAACFYFGLQGYKSHDLVETTVHFSRFWHYKYHACQSCVNVSDVGAWINASLGAVGKDVEFDLLVRDIAEKLDSDKAASLCDMPNTTTIPRSPDEPDYCPGDQDPGDEPTEKKCVRQVEIVNLDELADKIVGKLNESAKPNKKSGPKKSSAKKK